MNIYLNIILMNIYVILIKILFMSSLPKRLNSYISSETRTTPIASNFHVMISNNLCIDSDETFIFMSYNLMHLIILSSNVRL